MERESRRREIARRKRNRKRQLRRRLAGGAAVIAVGLAAFVCVWRWSDGREMHGLGNNGSADHSEREPLILHVGETEQEENTGLPKAFDLRESCGSLSIPDQGIFQTCWAFASLKAIETTVRDDIELSADHMSMQNSFGLGQAAGGDYSMASAYLLAWQGPVAESVDPYGDGVSSDNAEPLYHVQEIQILGTKDLAAIKRAVYETGGVQSACYMPQMFSTEWEQYYREKTSSFYYNGAQEPNHDIVILGWDDHYPRGNFVQEPECDGAFLCMNTWGAEFGENGCFYVSYEDSRIGEACVVYTEIESPDNYDRIYQTDLCGWTGQIGYGNTEAWFANVYEARERVELAAAGFYATAPETSYRVFVEVLGASGEFAAGKAQEVPGAILAAEGRVENVGYYTIPFEEMLTADAGERFAVIVEIDSPGTTEPVAMEYRSDSRLSKVDIGDGEGYISLDGLNWERTETEYACNVCLKVYANRK